MLNVFTGLLIFDIHADSLDSPCQENPIGLREGPCVLPHMVLYIMADGSALTSSLVTGQLPLGARGRFLTAWEVNHRNPVPDDEVRKGQDTDIVIVIATSTHMSMIRAITMSTHMSMAMKNLITTTAMVIHILMITSIFMTMIKRMIIVIVMTMTTATATSTDPWLT